MRRGKSPSFETQYMTPGYFSTLQDSVCARARFFCGETLENQAGVAIVNESFARRFWPSGGCDRKANQLQPDPKETPQWNEIVGIVKDVRDVQPTSPSRPEVFLPSAQNDRGYVGDIHPDEIGSERTDACPALGGAID